MYKFIHINIHQANAFINIMPHFIHFPWSWDRCFQFGLKVEHYFNSVSQVVSNNTETHSEREWEGTESNIKHYTFTHVSTSSRRMALVNRMNGRLCSMCSNKLKGVSWIHAVKWMWLLDDWMLTKKLHFIDMALLYWQLSLPSFIRLCVGWLEDESSDNRNNNHSNCN